jgi:hypothetical protein
MATHSKFGTPWPNNAPTLDELEVSGVYLIHCPTQNIGYVGSARRLKPRFTQHWARFAAGVHPSRELQQIYNEEGVDALEYTILATLPVHVTKYDRQLLSLEAHWIMRLGSEGMTLTNIRTASKEELFTLDGRFQLSRSRGRAYLLANPQVIDKQIELWGKLKATVTR